MADPVWWLRHPRQAWRRGPDAVTCEVKPSGDRQMGCTGLCEPGPGDGSSPGSREEERRTQELGCMKRSSISQPGCAVRGLSVIQLAAGTGQTGQTVLPGFPGAGPPWRAIPDLG